MNLVLRSALLLLFVLTLGGCELVGDVLQFGFWVGVIVVLIVVALIVWLIRKIF